MGGCFLIKIGYCPSACMHWFFSYFPITIQQKKIPHLYYTTRVISLVFYYYYVVTLHLS
ncbi:hypothetical protein BDA99DRAFT_500203 [Phascolomyces articulosus]|uniref:Uncharacterized protein n=1 Tax=Phascolomyces articulosus TaxID=60185 RepID=A0AAD5PH45_9FUNG|nr:hypothetical protein BDA99DRAFT_500203 [Phascolomyces articulosus]